MVIVGTHQNDFSSVYNKNKESLHDINLQIKKIVTTLK